MISALEKNLLYDNESLYKICENKWMIDAPSFYEINKLIVNHVSSILAPIRFNEWSTSGN